MNLEEIKSEIKKEEGFRDTVYDDHLGFATIGYGHLIKPSDNSPYLLSKVLLVRRL